MATPRTIAMSAFKAVGAASPASVARALLALALGALLAGCDNRQDLVHDKNMVAVPIGAVGHYGSGITITEYSINGYRGGRQAGWAAGGAGHCCVLLPRKVTKPVMVRVKWATTRTDVDEFREHEATVPVNFAVQPGEGGSGLYVHFLPGHRVEVWYAGPLPGSTAYPGPASPNEPAPPYAPLTDEKPRSEAAITN